VVTALAFASKGRCATIKFANSVAMSTFESSSAPPERAPRPPVPGRTYDGLSGCERFGEKIAANALQSFHVAEFRQRNLAERGRSAVTEGAGHRPIGTDTEIN
jgi:hypothetical protein